MKVADERGPTALAATDLRARLREERRRLDTRLWTRLP